MTGKKIIAIAMIISCVILLCPYKGLAFPDDETIEAMKQKIQELQKRVEELENSKPSQEQNNSFWGRPERWDPFAELERMQEEMNQMFQHSFGRSGLDKGIFSNNMSFKYDFDIKEEKDRYEITFDMTGLDEKKIDIEINANSITVKGERSAQETTENQNSFISSRSYGTFLKTIPVPADADTTRAKTEKRGDKLIIILPKNVT